LKERRKELRKQNRGMEGIEKRRKEGRKRERGKEKKTRK